MEEARVADCRLAKLMPVIMTAPGVVRLPVSCPPTAPAG